VKYGSAGKCRQKFRRKFRGERVPSRQTIHNLVNKLRTTGFLIDKKTKHKGRVLTEEKLDETGARLFLLELFEGQSLQQ
jgi:transposase